MFIPLDNTLSVIALTAPILAAKAVEKDDPAEDPSAPPIPANSDLIDDVMPFMEGFICIQAVPRFVLAMLAFRLDLTPALFRKRGVICYNNYIINKDLIP